MRTRPTAAALIAVIALFALGACESEDNVTDVAANELGSFQLVGRVESVTTGTTPDIEIEEGTPSPDGENTPSETGALKVTVQSSSAGLRGTCGVERGSSVEVWWLTGTRFDPATILTDLEDELDGRRISAQGRIFGTGASSTSAAATSPPDASPVGSPTASPGVDVASASNCVLVADHIEVSQGNGGSLGPTSTPLATVSASPAIPPTPSPTVSPGAPAQP